MPRLDDTAKALLTSQSGPMSGAALSAAHAHRVALVPLAVATIVQRVHGRVCLLGVVSRWRRLRQRCAAKQVRGSRPTSWSATWIWVWHTTLVSPVRADGIARPGAAHRNGVALASARRLKERTYLELVGRGARARLKSAAVGLGRRRRSCACWPNPKPGPSHLFSGGEWSVPSSDPCLWCRSGVCLLVAEPPRRVCGWW